MNRQKCSLTNSVVCALKVLVLVVGLLMAVAFAQNPVPQIVGPVKPMTVAPGSGAFTLTVYGANFVSGAVVNWNTSLVRPRSFPRTNCKLKSWRPTLNRTPQDLFR